jgi:hypothetical protein
LLGSCGSSNSSASVQFGPSIVTMNRSTEWILDHLPSASG